MNAKLGKVIVESIDLKKLASGLISEVAKPALEKAVLESPNKIDDMIMASLYPLFEAEMSKMIEEKLDLAKILKLEE